MTVDHYLVVDVVDGNNSLIKRCLVELTTDEMARMVVNDSRCTTKIRVTIQTDVSVGRLEIPAGPLS